MAPRECPNFRNQKALDREVRRENRKAREEKIEIKTVSTIDIGLFIL
jgi:hypothetical protein